MPLCCYAVMLKYESRIMNTEIYFTLDSTYLFSFQGTENITIIYKQIKSFPMSRVID